jgi:hypothetical protein
MHARRTRAKLLLLLPALLLCGCRALALRTDDFSGAVQVQDLDVRFASQTRGELLLELAVQNPTQVPAELRAARFELSFEGQRFATGITQLEGPLERGATRPLRVAFPLVLRATGEGVGGGGQVRAAVLGSVRVSFDGVERELPFGRVKLLPRASVPLPPLSGEP